MVFVDDVFYAYLELVAEANTKSLSGTYSMKMKLMQLASWHMDTMSILPVTEGGSYYIKGEEKKFIREGDGAITIVDNGGTLTITGDNLGILNLEALIRSGSATWSVPETPGSLNVIDATKL